MSKRCMDSGWGAGLHDYMHEVLCCLTNHTKDGLWVNHYTWTNDGPDNAHCVATWKRYGKKDAMAFIIGAEIYEHLEKVSDRFEDVATTMSAILVEHL